MVLLLGTGMGKTLIAVMLIQRLMSQLSVIGSKSPNRKWTFFVANTVQLVCQQANILERHLPVKVVRLSHPSHLLR